MELSPLRFVTRDEALRQALRQAAASPGAAWLVSGPPGAGKTALAEALLLAGAPRSGRALRVQAPELGGDAALLALLRRAGQRPLLLEDVDRLGARSEARLAEALRRGGPRHVALTVRCDAGELEEGVEARGTAAVAAAAAAGSVASSSPPALLPHLCRLPAALLRRVHLPPLAERRADVALLAEHFCPRGLSLEPGAPALLAAAAWPDGAKGLRAVVRVAARRCLRQGERRLTVAALAPLLAADARASATLGGGLAALVATWEEDETFQALDLRHRLRLVEAAFLARALAASGGRVTAAARLVGTPASTLRSRLAALAPELALAARWLL